MTAADHEEEHHMLAAIHTCQIHAGPKPMTCAALATDTDSALFLREGHDQTDRSLAGLEAFAALYEQAKCSPVRLHISDAGLRSTLEAVSDSFPAVDFVDTPFGPLGPLLRRASDTIGAHVVALAAEEEARRDTERAQLPPLAVATDASKARRFRGTGLGCVSEKGVHRMLMAPDARSILEGELLAIEMATTKFPDRDLHILTDSRLAIACLAGTYKGRPAVSGVVDRIHRSIQGRSVRFDWVRGHDGHPLNEAAHRLAVAARRCYDAKVSPAVAAEIARNIVASLDESRTLSA
ncbi:ribonuclease HI [Rhodococcus coprophilus]|uniref:ribonuclease HI n=1 Tax=Rhodococcus coprophilus TaxID=38310 RepID=UPI0037BC06C3